MESAFKSPPSSLNIEKLSPWLGTYQHTSGTESIFIPGQLTKTKSKPHTSELVKVVKLDPKVTVLQSLRRPMKLTFYGTDGRTYTFIAKYGEDLRQDQRVQQLLSIMSEKMEADEKCHVQHLKINTYNVTPIDDMFGLLNWVPNTIQLKEAIQRSHDKREMRNFDYFIRNIAQKQHAKLIKDMRHVTYANVAIENDRKMVI